MAKVEIGVPTTHADELLRWLQDEHVLHLSPLERTGEVPETDTAYQLAKVQSALEFLSEARSFTNTPAKRGMKTLLAGKPEASLPDLEQHAEQFDTNSVVAEIEQTRAELAEKKGDLHERKQLAASLRPWRNLAITGLQLRGTGTSAITLAHVAIANVTDLTRALDEIRSCAWQEVSRLRVRKSGTVYLEIVCAREDAATISTTLKDFNAVEDKLELADEQTPAQAFDHVTGLAKEDEAIIRSAETKAGELLKHEEALQKSYDSLAHRLDRETSQSDTHRSHLAFVVSGWIPRTRLAAVTSGLEAVMPAAVLEVQPATDEEPPVMFANPSATKPFEAVTNIFGKPRASELDPSPLLGLFFLVAFGLALTDAGYGIVMMIGTALALKFMKLKRDLKNMIQLLFYAGAATTVLGALAGGWFGLELDTLPENGLTQLLLSMKVIDPVTEPLKLLMIAFAFGIVQLLFAWLIKAYDLWRQGDKAAAITDALAWFTLVVALFAYLAADNGIIAFALAQPLKLFLLANVLLLIATQGRAYKNIFIRVGAGVMSLYGLVNFLSDVLSYSRLLALGLATGIIGLVVNLLGTMAVEMIPVVGVVVAVVVVIGGHLFNLGINALGAFIHSGRLQFVEFFPKFLEGGGTPYKPFGRAGRYTDNPKDFE